MRALMKARVVTIPHPLRWLKFFVKALLYGPSWSYYNELTEKYNEEYGVEAGAKAKAWTDPGGGGGKAKAPEGKSKLWVSMGYGPGGYSDKDDESYYGL